MEKKMETTVVYWGSIGIMEKTMETTIYGYNIGVYNITRILRPELLCGNATMTDIVNGEEPAHKTNLCA